MKVGLSLGGGGSRGWAHIGAIHALQEAGVRIDVVNGTSMGAIVGGAYALYLDTGRLVDCVEQTVKNVNFNYFSLFRFRQEGPTFLRNWLTNTACDIASLRRYVQSHANNLKALRFVFGNKTFADTRLPFSAVAFDLLAGETVVIKRGKLVDGVLPSAAIPGIFPPVCRGRRLLVDGSVLANVPINELRKQGAEFIISVELTGTDGNAARPYRNGLDLITYVEALKQRRLDRWQMQNSDFHFRVNLGTFDSTRFDNYRVAIERGYEITRRMMPRLLRRLAERGA